jgi:dienelactone hydrolase
MRQLQRIGIGWLFVLGTFAIGQPLGQPDRDNPGDEMIQAYLNRITTEIEQQFAADIQSPEQWNKLRPEYRQQYFYMLGLSPMPEVTPLQATITGTLSGEGFIVQNLHYQSHPGLYVTASLYRPSENAKARRLPAVLYVCGHSNRGRDGNKTAYQSHGIWLARHGYICLTLDSLQLGEIAAIHHGTYREGRWWWHSRGYTPAGVECLNGIRGIDYLISRPDVDPQKIAVTGISGGGAATYWIAAADERIKAAVPVSGMADLLSYIPNRVINGHCDCMFLYNTFQWPWTRIAALIAPRPMMFTNSDQDSIFPMDANERVSARLERIYSLYGVSDRFDTFVSIGGHAYRQDIRQAAFRFLNTYLKGDPAVVTDSEVDLVTEANGKTLHPIEPEKLRVFPQDSDIPKDELNTTIDRHFVPIAQVTVPAKGEYEKWKQTLVSELRRVTFRSFPERIPPAELLEDSPNGKLRLTSEPGIQIGLETLGDPAPAGETKRILLIIQGPGAADGISAWANGLKESGDRMFLCTPRGVGATRWTQKNPPNFVERSLVLLGRTADTGRVWDIIAVSRYLRARHGDKLPIVVASEGAAGVLAAYAALWDADISGVILQKPPASHMDPDAPQFLNVLRVCDIPDILGMLSPRPLTVYGGDEDFLKKTAAIYAAAGAADQLHRKP